MRADGASEAEIAAQLAIVAPTSGEPEPEAVELDADAVAAITLLYASETQWKWAGMGVRVGLDYAAIEPASRLLGIDLNHRIFLDLRILEAEALSVFADQARRTRP